MIIGFALTGSFCTIDKVLKQVEYLATKHTIIPICSQNVYNMDTRFNKASNVIKKFEDITKNKVICSIDGAEPIGPKNELDVFVVAPCTGNTIGKIANGITDSCVPMAVKAHIRNDKPVVIGISTNDGLSNSAINIGKLLNSKNFYFIPYGQDDCIKKATSLVADFSQLEKTIEFAKNKKQIQPILLK